MLVFASSNLDRAAQFLCLLLWERETLPIAPVSSGLLLHRDCNTGPVLETTQLTHSSSFVAEPTLCLLAGIVPVVQTGGDSQTQLRRDEQVRLHCETTQLVPMPLLLQLIYQAVRLAAIS